MKCGKVRYSSRARVARARDTIDRKKGVLLQAYFCAPCKAWHLGNDQYTRLENMNRIFDRLPASDRANSLQTDNQGTRDGA